MSNMMFKRPLDRDVGRTTLRVVTDYVAAGGNRVPGVWISQAGWCSNVHGIDLTEAELRWLVEEVAPQVFANLATFKPKLEGQGFER